MRGRVAGLESAAPVALRLPGVYQEDEFLQRFAEAFDGGLAPVLATLDGLAAYVDPWLAPEDFLEWVAGWVGVELDDAWSVEQRREIVAGAALVHRSLGTTWGVADAVRMAVGGDVEVVESGGACWSARSGGELPGDAELGLHVRVTVGAEETVDQRRVDAVVAAVKPAHVPHTVEVVTAAPVTASPMTADSGTAEPVAPETAAPETAAPETTAQEMVALETVPAERETPQPVTPEPGSSDIEER